MARGLNRIMLIGNVGQDPDVRLTQSGSKVVGFSLATNRTWKEQDGAVQERTDWHRCTVWGKLADIVEQYVSKGDRLYVEGRMEYGSYERDGITIPTAEVQVKEVVMLGSHGGEPGGGGQGNQHQTPISEPDDDLPF